MLDHKNKPEWEYPSLWFARFLLLAEFEKYEEENCLFDDLYCCPEYFLQTRSVES